MNTKTATIWLALLLTLLTLTSAAGQVIRPGDSFPEVQLEAPASVADRAYLQLTASSFTPSQIGAKVLVIEFLNVHCPHCQMQTPAYNELFKLIEANPETRGKIKMLAIAVGNLEREVATFRARYLVPFPILADPGFNAWRAIDGRSTPFSIYLRQDQPGQAGIVTGTHLGLNTNYQRLYQNLIRMTDLDPEKLKQQVQVAAEKHSRLQPILSPAELEYRVRSAFTRFGAIEDFVKLELLSGRQVYSALIRQGESTRRLFAEVTSRTSVCDICHDVHFIYLFDRTTEVIAFEPLQLTKYGNVNWSAREISTMRQRLLGKHLTIPQPFNPSIDAISTATMTSAIIFDSLAQGDELIAELRDQGLL